MRETVIVTASAGALPGLIPVLRAIPAAVEEHPLLIFADPDDWGPVDRALGRLEVYRAIVFTSPRAAHAVRKRLHYLGIERSGGASDLCVWAGGSLTAAALQATFGPVRIPAEADIGRVGAAAALFRAMQQAGTHSPVLFPCGDTRREELPERLRANRVDVDEVICYRSILASPGAAQAAAARATVVVVASPRVAELLAVSCPPGQRPDLIAVGPTTAQSARDAGWLPAAVAEIPTAEGVGAAVQTAIAQRCS